MERVRAPTSVALVVCSCLIAHAAWASPAGSGAPSLKRAAELANEFKDVEAEQMLRELLRHPHPADQQAMAHLQLGLIALNRARTEEARAEFRLALSISPIVELPIDSSPKSRRLFAQVFSETPAPSVGPSLPAPPPPPPPSSSPAPVVVVASAGPSPPPVSHAASIALGAVAVVALGTGVTLGVVGENALGQAKSASDVGKSQSLAQGVGTDWLVADIAYGVAGAAAVAAVITFFVERGSGTTLAVVPTNSGALLSVGGQF